MMRFSFIFAALFGMCAVIACSSVVPPDLDFAAARCTTVIDDGVAGMPTWDIGAILELTRPGGAKDPNGEFYLRAMHLAVAELNDHRDISGRRVRVRVCDTHSDWATGGGAVSRDLANYLIQEHKVDAIITDASADTQTVQAVTVPAGVLLMAISATSEELTFLDDKGLVWRVAPSDLYQGAVLARLATETIDPGAKVGAVAVQSPYGDGLVDAMRKQLSTRLLASTFPAAGTGIDKAFADLDTSNLGSLVFVGTSPMAAMAANARAKVAKLANLPMFLADGACDKDLATHPFDAEATLLGARCVLPGQPPTETYQVFAERFKQRFGADPGEQAYTQHAFDAVYVVALGHAWATGTGSTGDVTGATLAEGLRHLSSGEAHVFKPNDITAMVAALKKGQPVDVEGASGLLNFNPETGEAPSDYEVWTLGKHGELTSNSYYHVNDLGGGKISVQPIAGK
ncbi:MAG: ABC transporter substrate-binding protein [Deltaproteobacteria bacterium]|nr:ABC transporter substrate-binding protein [Deltaproteobacteria bacterium]